MTNYAILRIQKLKKSDVYTHSAHVMRTQETLNANADLTKHNSVLLGSTSPKASVDAYFKAHKLKARNSTTVHAVEMLLTASPDFFRAPGKLFDTAKVKQFSQIASDFVKSRYGDRAVFAMLHLDEQTPHVHVTIVPECDGKLNAKALFDKKELVKLQDDFANVCEPLGLQRGMRGSKAKHVTIKRYYKLVNECAVQITKNYKPMRKPSAFDLFGTDYIDEVNANLRKAVSYAAKKHEEAGVLKSRNEALDKRNDALRKERDAANAHVTKLETMYRAERTKRYSAEQDALWNQKLLDEVMREQPDLINQIMKKRERQIAREYHAKLEELKKQQKASEITGNGDFSL